jgi:protein phosphatase 1 regulatory subunit 7
LRVSTVSNSKHLGGESYAFSKLILEEKKIDDLGVAFRAFPHIRDLNLSRNDLRCVDELMHLPYLINADVSRNRIKDYKFFKENPECLKYLDSINFSLNQLRDLTDLPQCSLANVNMQKNKIASCADFGGAPAVKVLELQFNRLTDLKGLGNMPSLLELYLGNNKIVSLKGLTDLPALKKLDLSNNLIKEFDEVPALDSLENFNVAQNKIASESELGKLSPFRNLKVLNMAETPLVEEKGDDFKREVLIALDMLKCIAEVNEDEVTEDDRNDAKTEKEERIRAAKEAEEEAS